MRRHVPFIVLALASFVLATLDIGSADAAGAVHLMRTATATVIGPVQKATAETIRPVGRVLSSFATLGREREEVRRLRTINHQLTAENIRLRALDYAASNAPSAPDGDRGELVPARVIALGPLEPSSRTATVDVGFQSGVREGAGVLADQGVVGRVLRSGPETSTVLLLCDPRSTVGARLGRSRELGLLQGQNPGKLTLTMIDSAAQIRPGDLVVSWGSRDGRPYPPDAPLGRVVAVERASGGGAVATVRPAVDFTALDRVMIQREQR